MTSYRTIIIFFLICIVNIMAGGAFFYHQLTRPVLTQGFIFEIKAGDQKGQFANHLAAQGLTSYPRFFAAYMYLHKQTIKRGEYFFAPGSSLASIWLQVSKGTGFYYRSFTIVPGWTVQQLRQALLATNALHHEAVYQNDAAWSKKFGFATVPEGLFFPETYFYTKGASDWRILSAAKQLMERTLSAFWATRTKDVPFTTPYDALIAASLIEKEAYYDDERPVIAGVLVNRLNKKMLLQFDPSVIYGLGVKYDGTLHTKDLKEKTPYNTYVNKGLPPTPIAFPGIRSIQAALHPEQHDYLYFVVEGEKRHRFSTTLEMHNEAVTAYKNKRRGNDK